MRVVVVIAVCLACVSEAHADLIEVDLFAPGDALLTRDTDTGLDWLDLTETTDISYLEVLANAEGWQGLGFVHATSAQVEVLFLHSAPVTMLGGPSPLNVAGATNLTNLLGNTIPGSFGGLGVTADGPAAGRLFESLYEVGDTSAVLDPTVASRPADQDVFPCDKQIWGQWLIRPSGVPLAHVGLIEVDLFSPGDGLLTRDTDTGLDWLDLTETTDISYPEVLANAEGWQALGFVHATSAQVEVLFTHSAPVTMVNFVSPLNVAGVTNLANLLGSTIPGSVGGLGVTADGPAAGQLFESLYELGGSSAVLDPTSGSRQADQAVFPCDKQIWGQWLIRASPVPEPGTLILSGLAGAGVLVSRRRKRTV